LLEVAMTVSPWWYGPQQYDYGRMLASTADRERALDVLRAGFAEGRLTKDEHDARVSRVYNARTYADLAVVTADLPGGQASVMSAWPPPAPVWQPANTSTNGLAVASLICGIGQLLTAGLTGIPAIVLGHTALRQIRRTGEEGKALATVGLTLGWIGTTFMVFVLFVIIMATTSGGPGG
jgi:Domain of unknown function (DUF1707)/Domain of unknown function (DUF4190)